MERKGAGNRPDWCAGIDCPYYESNGRCQLRAAIADHYSNRSRRNHAYVIVRQLAIKDPGDLVERCRNRKIPYVSK